VGVALCPGCSIQFAAGLHGSGSSDGRGGRDGLRRTGSLRLHEARTLTRGLWTLLLLLFLFVLCFVGLLLLLLLLQVLLLLPALYVFAPIA
jgi:hypothetical protein